jgi:hypothetical protein
MGWTRKVNPVRRMRLGGSWELVESKSGNTVHPVSAYRQRVASTAKQSHQGGVWCAALPNLFVVPVFKRSVNWSCCLASIIGVAQDVELLRCA